MQVQLKNNVFTATQWFKDGDHPAVYQDKVNRPERYIVTVRTELNEDEYGGDEIIPGDWIVEMHDGIHLYSDEEFREMFVEAGYYAYNDERCVTCTGDCQPPYNCGAIEYCCGEPEKMKANLK